MALTCVQGVGVPFTTTRHTTGSHAPPCTGVKMLASWNVFVNMVLGMTIMILSNIFCQLTQVLFPGMVVTGVVGVLHERFRSCCAPWQVPVLR
jgi:hypothetical protein